jgi:hypothetical protein
VKHWLFGGSLLAAAACALGAAGCSSRPEGPTAEESTLAASDSDDAAELDKVLGDDRVARAFRASPTAIPSQLSNFENLLKVGRACNRSDSKEIFIIEEKNTRLGGVQADSDVLLPRAVFTGCNQNVGVASAIRQSFELFVAVVSDKTHPTNNPFSFEPVEAMALDQTTGLYNFYILHKPEQAGRPATVVRFARNAQGQIEKFSKEAGKPATKEISKNHECFNCHVNGGPIMNELTQPWTGWVSSNQIISRQYTGETRDIISESRPFAAEHTRSSLANELERTTRAAISMWVEGLPERPGSGLGPQTLAGKQPGGVPALLRSVFCETEFNFTSAFDYIPMQMFADDVVGGLASLERPQSLVSTNFPVHFPVRAQADKNIDGFLQKKGILRQETSLAARAVDDEHDILSTKRCALHAETVRRINAGATPNDAAKAAILASVGNQTGARADYIRALLTGTPDALTAAEAAYIADLTARYNADTAKLTTDAGMRELQRRLDDRQRAAQAMFNRPANPLPAMHPNP